MKFGDEEESATTRFHACVMVRQIHVERVLNGPPPEEFDAFGMGFVDLVSINKKEGYTSVGASYLLPRVYSLLETIGWHFVDVGEEDVFCT